MLFEIVVILGEQVRVILDDQEVLGVAFLGGLGEVEGARDHRRAVDHHDLVVGDGVLRVEVGWNAGVIKERRARLLLGPLALVQDHADLHAPFMGRG